MSPIDQVEQVQPTPGSNDSTVSRIASDIWPGGVNVAKGAVDVVKEHPVETAAVVVVAAICLSKGKLGGLGRSLAPASAFESSLTPATEKLLASSIPITAEARAAAMLGRAVTPATEALLAGSIPITAETRAAAMLGRAVSPATEALLTAGIPITAETRAAAAMGLGRVGLGRAPLTAATDSLIASGIPITAEARAIAANPAILRLPVWQRSSAIKAAFAIGK